MSLILLGVSNQVKCLTEIDNIACGRWSANQIFKFVICLFFKDIIIFRHFELEIALAIPAQNDEK